MNSCRTPVISALVFRKRLKFVQNDEEFEQKLSTPISQEKTVPSLTS
jgi:hypothetical protein